MRPIEVANDRALVKFDDSNIREARLDFRKLFRVAYRSNVSKGLRTRIEVRIVGHGTFSATAEPKA